MPATFEHHLAIAADPARVWRALVDTRDWPCWLPGLIAVDAAVPVIAAGATFRETRELFGRTAVEEFEVVECVDGERLHLRIGGAAGHERGGRVDLVYALAPAAAGTELRVRGEFEVAGALARLFRALTAALFAGAVRRDLAAFAAWVEAAVDQDG